ncbi:glycoside hydrolase family 27 protein [Mycolicibacterium sp. CBM1]
MSRFLSTVTAVAAAGAFAVSASGCERQVNLTVTAPEQIMGWNSWNSGIELTEQSVLQTIDAMVSSGMRDVGYRYVNLDAGWAAATRDDNGDLVADPIRFPHGLAPVVRYAHDRGLLFGLYSSPFGQTCGQGTATASLGHEKRDAATFAAWGVDFLKYDWCRNDADHNDQVNVFGAMRAALDATGRKIVYSINPNSSDDPAAGTRYDWSGVADVVRTSGDLLPVWRYVLPPQGPDDPFVHGGFNGVPDQFAAALTAADHISYRGDPDMLVVGVSWKEFFDNHRKLILDSVQSGALAPEMLAALKPMLSMPAAALQWITDAQPSLTEDEQRTHFSLWAMLGAPLIAGNDLRSMSPQTAAILTNRAVIDVDRDPLRVRPTMADHDPHIWFKPLSDFSVAVALLNISDAPVDLRTSAAEIGLPAAPCYTVHNLWTGSTTSTSGFLFAPALPAHAVALLRVSAGCAS